MNDISPRKIGDRQDISPISPIMATLLLIVIVIAIAAIIVTYAWITTYMSEATQQAGVMLDVENVYWDSDAKITTIYVKNTG